MNLLSDGELEESAVVANCRMNRERDLSGTNGYDRDLRFAPLSYLQELLQSGADEVRWLDLCCGTGKAIIEAAATIGRLQLPISIVGVDLVGMFRQNPSRELRLVEASLTHWKPERRFELITCVHGLHYIGDKLGLIQRSLSWLTPDGRFAANLDADNLRFGDDGGHCLIDILRKQGMQYSSRTRVLQSDGVRRLEIPADYVGADDKAGPNYTGQPAVNSYYRSNKS